MARPRSYGDLLRDARERRGMDLATVSRRLRIRPDILKAIEEADFSRMPPRGYTRNMINAYARLVGLNAQEVTALYLDEVHAHETGRTRVDERRSQAGSARRQRSSTPAPAERGQRARRDQQSSRTRSERTQPSSSSRGVGGLGMLDSLGSSRARNGDRAGSTRGGLSVGGNYPSLYSSAQQNRTAQASRLPLIIGVVAVVVLLIVVLVFVFSGNKQAAEEVPNVPISGLTDTSNPETEPEAATSTPVAPTSATFTYEVGSQDSWIELYYDGSSDAEFAGVVSDKKEDISVTGTLKFRTANPEPVKVYVDGEEVELTLESDGYYSYTVDFNAILAQWQQDNAVSSSSSAATSSSSSASSSSRASSASSSSSSSTS